jgi:hypothetical protein
MFEMRNKYLKRIFDFTGRLVIIVKVVLFGIVNLILNLKGRIAVFAVVAAQSVTLIVREIGLRATLRTLPTIVTTKSTVC